MDTGTVLPVISICTVHTVYLFVSVCIVVNGDLVIFMTCSEAAVAVLN